MRIWLVPFYELDDKRLLAQHHEWHVLENHIHERGRRWLGWEKPEHTIEFYSLHDQVLAEMIARGMTGHKTPPKHEPSMVIFPQVPYPRTAEAIRKDRMDLVERWGGTFAGRYTTDPDGWSTVMIRYNALRRFGA